jgi:NAD-dependent deacetylase
MNPYLQIANRIARSRHVVALTGAGISVESGIPDFRSKGGLWSKYDPVQYAHIDAFRANPAKVWKMLLEMDQLFSLSHPNAAHTVLADLEKRGLLKSIVTQNIDSLHQRAGSTNVIEFHGHFRSLRCDECGREYGRESVSLERLPPSCGCGGPLRPEIVFFGEIIPQSAYQDAIAAAQSCDLMMVIGTSATVAPASLLPPVAKEHGAYLLEINPIETGLSTRLSDHHLAESAGKVLPAILAALDDGMAS